MTQAKRAVRVGMLVINLPILVLIFAPALFAPRLGLATRGIGLVGGLVIGWLYWSIAIPRWRRWAISQGADPQELQQRAVAAGLVWPRGWILEKTELPPRRSTDP